MFRVYLSGISFKIVADCEAFELTMRKKDLRVRVARWALFLEEFNYILEHRPGRNMTHVDALIRNSLPTTMLVEENEESIMVRFKKAQAEDKDLQEIWDNIEQYEVNGYVLKNNILYKEVSDEMLVVVTKSMYMQVLG